MQKPSITRNQHIFITVLVIICYVIVIAYLEFTFDEAYSNDQILIAPIFAIQSLYDILYLCSSVITLISIYKVYKMIKLLSHSNRLGVNKCVMALHVILLILATLFAIVSSLIGLIRPKAKYFATAFFVWADMILQIIICYVCGTIGSSVQLRQYKVIVV